MRSRGRLGGTDPHVDAVYGVPEAQSRHCLEIGSLAIPSSRVKFHERAYSGPAQVWRGRES